MVLLATHAILFDLDGVLVDSISSIDRAMEVWCSSKGLDHDEIKTKSRSIKDEDLIRSLDLRLNVSEEKNTIRDLEIQYANLVTAHQHAHHITSELNKYGVPWGIVTSGQRDVAVARLLSAGIQPPEVMITSDDCSNGKPNREPYTRAAVKLGVTPQDCVVIEDTLVGIVSGKAAGSKAVAITTTYPRTQFGDVPDMIIERLNQIIVGTDGVIVNGVTL